MPRTYNAEKYRAYAQSDKGRAARAAARARYVEKRRPQQDPQYNPAPLAQALTHWRAP